VIVIKGKLEDISASAANHHIHQAIRKFVDRQTYKTTTAVRKYGRQ